MLSLILPTFNEVDSLENLIPKIVDVLKNTLYEIIVVDDNSPDGTSAKARHLGRTFANVHVIRRIDRSGLSSAIIEGLLASKGDILAVMDADGQHDLSLLPQLEKSIEDGNDIAIGSRYTEGGSVGNWDERRYALSRLATTLAIRLCRVKTTDPMSGFFMLRRTLFESILTKLNPKGFKILLDILVHIPVNTKIIELPFTFGIRTHGESKLSKRVQIEFLEYLYEVTIGHYIPLLFIKYCLVGLCGVLVNFAVYSLFNLFMGLNTADFSKFNVSIIGGIEAAIVFNFLLNNYWTFARHRLKRLAAFIGFIKYNAACLLGALANFAVYFFLITKGIGEIHALLLAGFVGVSWNYTMSRSLTWKM